MLKAKSRRLKGLEFENQAIGLGKIKASTKDNNYVRPGLMNTGISNSGNVLI